MQIQLNQDRFCSRDLWGSLFATLHNRSKVVHMKAPRDENAILQGLTSVFRRTLDDGQLVIAANMTAKDVDRWDSLSHVSLIVAIEERFNIKFKLRDIVGFKHIGDMCRAILLAEQSRLSDRLSIAS
jgi:acyl carrier protein